MPELAPEGKALTAWMERNNRTREVVEIMTEQEKIKM